MGGEVRGRELQAQRLMRGPTWGSWMSLESGDEMEVQEPGRRWADLVEVRGVGVPTLHSWEGKGSEVRVRFGSESESES